MPEGTPKNLAMNFGMRKGQHTFGDFDTTTIEQVKKGARTGSTRSASALKGVKPGEIVTFEGRDNGLYRITDIITLPENPTPEFKRQWAAREGWTVEQFDRFWNQNNKLVSPGSKQIVFQQIEPPRGDVGPSRTPGLKKIISGMQSGGDLFGLEAAQKLGIQTGGYGAGASGAVTKDSSGRNIEAPELRDKFGIAPVPPEIQQQFEQRYGKATGARGLWLPRTYANVSSSDATVYFIAKDNSAGLAATKRYADDLGKPFLIVDERKPEDMKKLADFSAANNIEVLNIAGNRELSNPAFVEQAISGAFGPSDLTSNLPMDPEQLIRNQQAAEMGKKLFANPQYALDKVPVPMSPQERSIREAMKGGALSGKEFYGGYPNKQALIEGIKRAYSQGVDVAELLPLIPAGVLSPEDHADLMKSRWEANPKTGGLRPVPIDPGIELAIEAVGAPGVLTEYGNQLPFSSYGITTGQPVGPGKSSEILSASQLKRIGGMDTLEKQLEALRDVVYDRGIQAHNEIKQNALNYMENTAGTPAGTKTIAGKIRDAQAGGMFSGATSEDLIDQMATGIADQALTGVSQRAGKYEPAVTEGTTTFEDPDRVLMRALVNSDIPFEQDPDAASASEGYKVDSEAAFIENMGDEKRFNPTVNTRPIEQLSPGERLAASLQGATGIPPLSESEIMKLAGEINRVKTATVQSFADQPELLLAQGRQQQMVWNDKTKKYETIIDYTGKERSAHSPLDYLNMWNEGKRGKLDLPYDPRDGGIRQLINIVSRPASPPASPQAMPPMDIGLGSNAGAVLGEQTGPRINPIFRYTPEDFGGNIPSTPADPSFDAAGMQQTFDVNQDNSFDLTGTSPTDSPVMQAQPVVGPPSPMEALPVTNNAKLKQKLKDPVGTMKGAGEWAIDKAKNNIITRAGGKANNFFDLPADSPLRTKIDQFAGDSKLKQGLGRSVRFGASLPGAAGRMGMPKAIGLDSLADIVELAKGAYKINQYEKFGTPKDLVVGRDVQNYDELIAHLVGRNTDADDGRGLAYITPDQGERLIGLKNELTAAYQRGEIKEAEEHPNYKTMRKLISEFTKNREGGPQGAFSRSINVLEPSSSDEMGWMPQWRKEVQSGQDNFIDEPEAQLTPYGMFHVPGWSDASGRAGSVEGAAGLGGGVLDHITNPYAMIPRIAEGVMGDNSSSYASLGDGFVRSPNYDTIRLRSDVDTKSLLGKPNEDKQKIIYDGTPYTNTRYWKWNPDSRTLVNRHTGTSVREDDTGIQNFGEKMRNWNEYTRRMRDAQSRGEGEGTFSGEGVQSKVGAIESDFKGRAMFDKYDHGHTARHAHEDFGVSDVWEEGSVFEDLPWYSKVGVTLDRAVDASAKMHSDAWEGVKGWFGSGQSDETEDPRRMDNIIRMYKETGDNPAHIVGYNRDMANPSWSENPYGRFATEQERLLRNLIPYWEHKESKYSDIYKLIGEGE